MVTTYLDIPGRPETFPPELFAHDPNLMPRLEETGDTMIVGRPETWPPGTFDEDPNRAAVSITSIVPATAVLGSPDFTLHVHGAGFTPESVIVFAGQNEPTTYVSATELTTGVDMSVWKGPDPAIQVQARGANGLLSNALTFAFEEAAARSSKRGH